MNVWQIPGLLGSSKYGCRISGSVDISSTQGECSSAVSRRHVILTNNYDLLYMKVVICMHESIYSI